jgi:hypothetical protein
MKSHCRHVLVTVTLVLIGPSTAASDGNSELGSVTNYSTQENRWAAVIQKKQSGQYNEQVAIVDTRVGTRVGNQGADSPFPNGTEPIRPPEGKMIIFGRSTEGSVRHVGGSTNSAKDLAAAATQFGIGFICLLAILRASFEPMFSLDD